MKIVLLLLLSAAGIVFASWMTQVSTRPPPRAQPVASALATPSAGCIYGTGVIETWGEDRSIGTPVSGIVDEVLVDIGQQVHAGEVLFRLDDRETRAALGLAEAGVATARARLDRLRSRPREPEVLSARAQCAETIASESDAQEHYQRLKGLIRGDTISADMLEHARFSCDGAQAARQLAQAQLQNLLAGASPAEIAVAEAVVAEASAQVRTVEVGLERLSIRAPVDATVLEVHVHPGEFASAPSSGPLLTLGCTRTVQVRVDIDQDQAWRIRPELKATAYLRGNHALQAPLRFVRIEPVIVPKRSLTGDTVQRLDTRVLQVIYRLEPHLLPLQPGLQVDVIVEDGHEPGSPSPTLAAEATP